MRATTGTRVVAVVLLLAVGAVGLRAWRGGVPASGGRLPTAPLLVVFTALETAGAILILIALPAVARRKRRRMMGELPRGLWWKTTAILLALVTLLLPFVVLLMGSRGGRDILARIRPAPPPVLPRGAHGRTPPPDGGWLTVAITAVVVAAAILLLLRWMRRTGEPDALPRPRHPLTAAVDAGQDALDRADGPRAAVIACYAAMEEALSRSGAAPRDADTPAEVLDRAAGAGLVRSAAATTLTRLFREARYSLHPMDEGHRHSARSALHDLRRDLESAR